MIRKTFTGLFLLALLVAIPTVAEAGLGCAQFITSSWFDRPMSGHLIGDELITLEKDLRGKGRAGGRGIGAEIERGAKVSRTFSVGIYQMADGSKLKIDCRDYTRWG